MKNTFNILFTLILVALLLPGCSRMADKLDNLGNPPPLNQVDNPTARPEYRPITWPLPEQKAPSKQFAGSLWQPGSRHFFRDQRASRVGDIVKVKIEISDRAELDNETTQERDTSESVNAPALLGLESAIYGLLPGNQNPDSLLSIGGSSTTEGTGTIEREEQIETEVAALITQVLPNGNMVIEGNQEIRVNYEIRNISVAGVIRPEDIKADNTIEHSQIAQARISYGGRGEITDIQQPRWGQQAIGAISPF